MVVLESLAQGTPTIVSNNTPWEILEEHNAGACIDNNLDILVNKIKFFLEQNYKRNNIDSCIRLAKQFSGDILVDSYERMYKEMVWENKD